MLERNAKQDQAKDEPALNEELALLEPRSGHPEAEAQRDAQPQEHEPGQEPDPGHVEPGVVEQAEAAAEADQEADAEPEEAVADRQ